MSYSLAEMLTGNEPDFAPDLVEAQVRGSDPAPARLETAAARQGQHDLARLRDLPLPRRHFRPVAHCSHRASARTPSTPNTGLSIYDHPVGPSRAFLLGTDDLGRDVLSRIIYGSRISLEVGIGATASRARLRAPARARLGLLRRQDRRVIARFIDILLAFPVLLFAIALVARFGAESEAHPLRHSAVPVAAHRPARPRPGDQLCENANSSRLRTRSVRATCGSCSSRSLPNLIALAIVYATLLIPVNIVLEATLSYLGLGIQPPTASWGNMISEAQTGDLYTIAWWFLVFPCIALFLTTLAFNLLGDGLRDALDPRQGRSQVG